MTQMITPIGIHGPTKSIRINLTQILWCCLLYLQLCLMTSFKISGNALWWDYLQRRGENGQNRSSSKCFLPQSPRSDATCPWQPWGVICVSTPNIPKAYSPQISTHLSLNVLPYKWKTSNLGNDKKKQAPLLDEGKSSGPDWFWFIKTCPKTNC